MYDQELGAANRWVRRSRTGVLVGLAVTSAATVLALAGTATGAGAAPRAETTGSCRISAMPVPAGATSSHLALGDPTGRYYVGSAYVPERGSVGLLWVDGKPTKLDLPIADLSIVAINSGGTMTGFVRSGLSVRGYVVRNGAVTELPPMRLGDWVTPTAINSRGDVVGQSEKPGTWDSPAVIWPADQPGTVRELPRVPGQQDVLLTGIDDDGTVIGDVSLPTGGAMYVWPRQGKPYALAAPSGASHAQVVAIRNGWVAGGLSNEPPITGVRWDLRTGRGEVTGPADSWPTDINNRGSIITYTTVAHRGRPVVTLPTLDGARWTTAKTISNNGTIAGSVFGHDGLDRAVIWHGC